MSSPKIPPYILQELPDITETVNYPIKNIQRIKYTCFDISKTLIAFGATSGGIYVFNRWPCEFIQLIPSKDGPITRLAISTDEKQIGFANGKGVVTVTNCEQVLSGSYSTTSSKEHQGNEITAMTWSRNMLFTGDDIGKVSVLQLQSFIAKRMFQSSTQIIMSLDSRICQLEAKGCMLLVSTLTRCYICNTVQEQYRQIGQKPRDGEFGACFANIEKPLANGTIENTTQDFMEVKKFNIVDDDDVRFVVGDEFSNTVIYCARPSSRLWEATVDGMVRRTRQFKQVLAKRPMTLLSKESYESESFNIEHFNDNVNGQSVNFTKLYSLNGAIFAYSRNSLYFLNVQDVDDTVWFDSYDNILECRIYSDMLYLWLSNGSLVSLRFMKLAKFLVNCYADSKFRLCAELCALFKEYLLTHSLSPKLHILGGLRHKIEDNDTLEVLESVIDKFDSLKSTEATQMKSGIYVVDNTYYTQTSLDDNIQPKNSDDNIFGQLPPEALQTLKGISVTVSDKLNSSKKILREKWEDFEEKMKHLSIDKTDVQDRPLQENEKFPKWIPRDDYTPNNTPVVLENDIIFRESSHSTVEIDNNNLEKDKVCKMLYQYSRLSHFNKETESNLISIIDNYAQNMNEIYDLMLLLEKYCLSIKALEESKFVPNNLFLTYLNNSINKYDLINLIIEDEVLYKYFVDSCIAVNIKTQKHSNIGCECGFPLPYIRTSQMPVFSELIDEFIEQQWTSQTKEQCYEVCKRMPHLWRKILYLRRNEDLINVLRILLQMLDENLLHSFLPQFTFETWERAIQLYATLYANICLNCNKKFENISVKDRLSWDHLGSLVIKSVGGRNAIKLMKTNANLIETGALTVKFYHSCLLVILFEKYDGTTMIPLVDTIYSTYDFKDSIIEVQKILLNASDGTKKNTALPLTVAATSPYWGLKEIYETLSPRECESTENTILNQILMSLTMADITDCSLCGLPLRNEVLIEDGGLWVFKCGHIFHGACLNLNKIKLCPSCSLQ